MKNILWLASWYPNKVEPLNGDFIERHAKAVSLLHSIFVLHVVKDPLHITPGNVFREERKYNDHCRATIVYYKDPSLPFKWLNRLISAIRYCNHFIGESRQYFLQHGKPDFIHVHIALRAGVIALILKRLYGIPYVISEQWTGYCPEASPNFYDLGWLSRQLWKLVVKSASGISAVSGYLGESLKHKAGRLNYFVVPNVVDTSIFRPAPKMQRGEFCFIHVSTLGYQKNAEDMLEGVRLLALMTDRTFKVVVYGPRKPELSSLCHSLGISDHVIFKGEVNQEILAADMQQAGALILYSRYETFGCVLIEANACGVPVIVSDIPVMHENVHDGLTGVFVPLKRPDLLAEKMLYMMNHKDEFSSKKISDLTHATFSYPVVAAQFNSFYHQTFGF